MKMEIRLFFQGVLMGFLVAVPVGPIGLLCINRTLSGGAAYGLASGLGVATADAISAAIVALGLTLVSNLLLGYQTWLQVIGGAVLFYLGLRVFLTRPAEQSVSSEGNGLMGGFASMFVVTFTHPATILSFIAIFAGFGVQDLSGNYLAAGILTAGIFLGSALWWIMLSGGMLLFHMRFTSRGLAWVHRISGILIAVFGILVLFGFIGN